MPRTKKEYDAEMRKLIRTASSGWLSLLLSEDEMRSLKECVERGYIAGVHIEQTASGKLVADTQLEIYATKDGLEFLENKHPDRRANIAIVLSIVAIVISVLSNLDTIISNVKLLLELIQSLQ